MGSLDLFGSLFSSTDEFKSGGDFLSEMLRNVEQLPVFPFLSRGEMPAALGDYAFGNMNEILEMLRQRDPKYSFSSRFLKF
jgi:hypothetical protein